MVIIVTFCYYYHQSLLAEESVNKSLTVVHKEKYQEAKVLYQEIKKLSKYRYPNDIKNIEENIRYIDQNRRNILKKAKEIIEKYSDSEYCIPALGLLRMVSQELIYERRFRPEDVSDPVKVLNLSPNDRTPVFLMLDAEIKLAEAEVLLRFRKDKERELCIQQALQNYQELIEKYPKDELADNAQLMTASYHAIVSQTFPREIEGYQEVIKKYPNSDSAAWAQYWIGVYYDRCVNDTKKTLKAFQEVIEKYFGRPYICVTAQKDIALRYKRLKNYSQAIIEFQKVIDNYPGYVDVSWIKEDIERCKLLLKLQKRGIDTSKYEHESIEKLKRVLKRKR